MKGFRFVTTIFLFALVGILYGWSNNGKYIKISEYRSFNTRTGDEKWILNEDTGKSFNY